MADPIDGQALDVLIAKGVTKATFHENGALASIEFGVVAPTSESQHEAPNATRQETRSVSAVGRLVPRAVGDSK